MQSGSIDIATRSLGLRRWGWQPSLLFWGVGLSLIIGFFATRFVQVGYYAGTFLFSVAMLVVMVVWIWQRVRFARFDWFEPINFFFVSMATGIALRGIYIAFGLYHRYTTFVAEEEFIRYVTLATLYGLIAVLFYLGGYMRTSSARQFAGRLPVFKDNMRLPVLYTIVAVLMIVGVGSLLVLLRASGFTLDSLSLTEFSRKRHYVETGHYLKSVPFLLFTAISLLGVVHFSHRRTVWFWVLFPVACFWPLYSSTRDSLLTLLLLPLIMRSYLLKPLSGRMVLLAAAVFAIILSAMFAVRGTRWRGTDPIASAVTASGIVDNIVGSRSFADVVTFAHVIRAVPSQINLQLGTSYTDLLFGPIPRSWWPNKPIPVGKDFGQIFYEQEGSVPPSMLAEAYMNFHLPGVVLVFLLFGFISRVLYEYLLINRGNQLVVGVYALVVVFVLKFTNSDFVINATQFITRVTPLLFAALLVSGGVVWRNRARQ